MAASDSWPLFGATPSAGSRIGPLGDPLGAHRRKYESFSLGRSVARTVESRPEQRSDVSALRARLHEGRGPSLKDGLRSEPPSIGDREPSSPKGECLRKLRILQGRGPRSLGEAVCAPTRIRLEQDAETPWDPSKPFADHR